MKGVWLLSARFQEPLRSGSVWQWGLVREGHAILTKVPQVKQDSGRLLPPSLPHVTEVGSRVGV